jgi:hypothetical protein
MDLFDFNVVLNLSKFSCADNLQLLPATGLYCRRLPHTTLYLLAERTFRPLTALEGSRRQLPPGTVFAAYLPDTLAGARHSPLPEKGSAVSLGAVCQWAPHLTTDAGFFYREIADAVYWDWPDSIPPSSNLKVCLNNRTEVYRGLFALAKFRALQDHFNGCLGYTRLLYNDIASRGMVPGLPDDRLAGFVQGKLTLKKEQLMDLGLLVAGEYTGEQKKRAWDNDIGPLAAQTVLDVTLFYNYLYIKTYLTFKNILNRQAETPTQKNMRAFFGYPAQPLNYQFGVSLELGGVYDRNSEQE